MKRRAPIRRALDDIAAHFNSEIFHGRLFGGTVKVDGLDVEISVQVRNTVAYTDVGKYREQALEVIATSRWQDSCSARVVDRSRFKLRPGKQTKSCESPIVAVAVFPPALLDKQPNPPHRFEFRCARHVDDHGNDARYLITVLRLSPDELKRARARRKEREEFARVPEHEKIARDADVAGKPELAAEIRAAAPRCPAEAYVYPRDSVPIRTCTLHEGHAGEHHFPPLAELASKSG